MKKKNPMLLLLMFVVIALTSCNKTWNCECSSRGKLSSVTPIHNLGRLGAKNVCDSYQAENNRTNGADVVCKLK
ncbi:MAG TPA: hypothetical protein PKM51_08180 [Chitinophagales bacterium]|nr:hypothetical protein [Chitinophagales bacterium]HNM32716.1 hypothetical protein [Chitinophagales bacterium]